ncbi:unnamed protein product [Ixodes hexagonus]
MPSFRSTEVCGSWPKDVGILAMEIYFPFLYVDQTELEAFDGVSTGKYTLGLGQDRMGFCSDREDINSLCLTVTSRLLERTGVALDRIGRLEVGTETIVDKSKSVKTVLMQLFEESGNTDIEGVDTTNACYGGTAALFNAAAWVESSAWDGETWLQLSEACGITILPEELMMRGSGLTQHHIPNSALVLIIFHQRKSASMGTHVLDWVGLHNMSKLPRFVSEPRSGARAKLKYGGSVQANCMLLSCAPRLLLHQYVFINILSFIPTGCVTFVSLVRSPSPWEPPKPRTRPTNTFYISFSFFYLLPTSDTIHDREVERAFMQLSRKTFEQKTQPSLLVSNQVGNMYTPSLYSCLASYLASCPPSDLAGRRVGLFSYGSGLAATLFSLRVSRDLSPESPLAELHASLADLRSRLAQRRKVAPQDFARMMKLREETHHQAPYSPVGPLDELFPGTWYLTAVDEMHRRSYKRLPLLDSNGKAPMAALKEDVSTNGQPVAVSGAH